MHRIKALIKSEIFMTGSVALKGSMAWLVSITLKVHIIKKKHSRQMMSNPKKQSKLQEKREAQKQIWQCKTITYPTELVQ